jgi:glycosyltransferase involved in cell wall biosynthesis
MNLLYTLPFWPYLYTPWLFREIAWMRDRGHHVAVLSLREPPGPSADLRDFELDDIPVLQLKRIYQSDYQLLSQMTRLSRHGLLTKTDRSLRQSIQESGWRQGTHEWANLKQAIAFTKTHGIDVIEAHWAAEAGDYARQIHEITGIPYAIRLHGGDLHRSPSPSLPRIVEHASAVCPVSEFLARLLRGERPVATLPEVPRVEFDSTKVRVCHNGLPSDSIAKQPAEQRADLQIIGTIGRLDPEKRYSDLIDAVARLADDFPGVRLRLIGGGQLQQALEQQAQALGIADRVEITGAQSWEMVMKMASELHIYVQASAIEGCSLATIEGQAQGVPVVLSRTGAHAQSIEESVNGYLFDSGDVSDLQQKLRQVLSADPETRQAMGAHSIRLIKERFCVDTLMPRLEAILAAVKNHQPLPE